MVAPGGCGVSRHGVKDGRGRRTVLRQHRTQFQLSWADVLGAHLRHQQTTRLSPADNQVVTSPPTATVQAASPPRVTMKPRMEQGMEQGMERGMEPGME